MKYMAMCIAIILLSISFSPVIAEHNGTAYYAILIGIGKENDVLGIYEELLKRDNWKRNNIILLLNENATRDGIMNAFLKIEKIADKNDFVFILYSGIGKTIKDKNGDEKDGYDEAIVTYDNLSINDDTIKNEIDKIKAAGIAIFLDCGYSNGIKKDIEGNNRVILASSCGNNFPYIHTCTKFFSHALKHADQNQSIEAIFDATKRKNNIFWASIPMIATVVSTYTMYSFLMAINLGINMARSFIQMSSGLVDAIEPYFYTLFFSITLLIYMPILLSINAAFVGAIITAYELFTIAINGNLFIPLSTVYDGYVGDMPFLLA